MSDHRQLHPEPMGPIKKNSFWMLLPIALIVILSLGLVFGSCELLELNRLRQEKLILESRNSQLKEYNRELILLINRLAESDPEIIEHLARHEHKMVRPGELILIPSQKTNGSANGR